MKTILKTNKGQLIQGNNLEVMRTFGDESFDNCISDFPYNLGFMGKKWDNQKNFYEWNYERALELFRIIKPGGFILIFGHPKTNHRMKSAFEDVGFNIIDEIDWIYSSGFPKNQDVEKLFLKKGKQELADKHKGWKTAGLKPAHEPITIFQKPLDKNYCNNIENYNCGAMNIDSCRVPYNNEKDLEIVKAKCNFTKNAKSIGFGTEDSLYGSGSTPLEQARQCVKEKGRFPANIIFNNKMGNELDKQSGWLKSGAIKKGQSVGTDWNSGNISHERQRGRKVQPKDIPSDEGGASRFFLNIDYSEEEISLLPFYYCAKTSKKERGKFNVHTTVKPKKLIKWLIKLVTPENGTTLDITAGSCTHGLCCEELNHEEEYNISWTNIELLNDEQNPYCDIGKKRINTYLNN